MIDNTGVNVNTHTHTVTRTLALAHSGSCTSQRYLHITCVHEFGVRLLYHTLSNNGPMACCAMDVN